MKVACACVSLVITTEHVGSVPAQAPDQFAKCRPVAGVALRITVLPCVNFAEQLEPQLIAVPNSPLGKPVTVPDPLRPIDKVKVGVKVAVTFSESFTVSAHVDCVPSQAPPQLVNTLPDPGLAVSVTGASSVYVEVHLEPQLMSLSAELTFPLPVLVTVTDGIPRFAPAICAPM